MRIEEHYGNKIVCGHIFKSDEIKVGQRWQGSSGSVVTIESVEDDWVAYSWHVDGVKKVHDKLSFAFQCRYCLIVEDEA